MKTTTSLKLVVLGVLAALSPVYAQSGIMAGADYSGGLLGQTYAGLEFGYTHHVESAPRELHRYAFVSNAPVGELGPQVDATFRYDHTRGRSGGLSLRRHDVAVAFTRYFTMSDGTKPFIIGQAGWAGRKTAGELHSSFAYLVGAGAEFVLRPRLTLTPYVNYREALEFDDRAWGVGAKLGYRMHREWSGTFGIQIDENHNIEYAAGFQRRF
jgi:hypothetical protein